MRAVTKEGLFCSSESGNLVWDMVIGQRLQCQKFAIERPIWHFKSCKIRVTAGKQILLRHVLSPFIVATSNAHDYINWTNICLFRIYNSFNLFHQNISKASSFQAKFDYLPHCLAEILLHQANVMHVVTCCCL